MLDCVLCLTVSPVETLAAWRLVSSLQVLFGPLQLLASTVLQVLSLFQPLPLRVPSSTDEASLRVCCTLGGFCGFQPTVGAPKRLCTRRSDACSHLLRPTTIGADAVAAVLT